MNEHNAIDLRLEEMTTQELGALLRAEVGKEVPNDDLVLQLLHLLEERSSGVSENDLTQGEEAAWRAYQKRVCSRARKKPMRWNALVKVASVVLIAGILIAAIPPEAGAQSLWERLATWTDSFFEFLSPNAADPAEEDYVFQTENQGLQQVYDAVVALGITDPVVPMWLPEGYELTECTTVETPQKKYVAAFFYNSVDYIVLNYAVNLGDRTRQYPKNETEVDTQELFGDVFYYIQNEDKMTVTWSKENTENYLTVDCQEDIVYKILESIYVWRDN